MKKTYLKYLKAFALVGIMTSLVVFTSCSDDDGDTGPTQTVWELIESNTSLSLLESEFSNFSSIETTLSDENANVTVFAPSDQALTVLLGTLGLDDFSSVASDIAQQVLEYHIVTSAAIASGELSGTITTLQTEAITVEADGTLSSGATSAAAIQTADIQATNGVIHIVDVVLIPPVLGEQIIATLGRLAQPVFLGADFTTLAAAIEKADAAQTDPTATITAMLIGAETDPTQLTVFAPTNATFAAAEITVDTYDAATWDAIIRNHIVAGQGGDDQASSIDADALVTGATYTTVGQGTLLFFFNTDAIAANNGIGVYIDSNGSVDLADQTTYTTFDAEVALPDAASGLNGRIHVIAGVLSPL